MMVTPQQACAAAVTSGCNNGCSERVLCAAFNSGCNLQKTGLVQETVLATRAAI